MKQLNNKIIIAELNKSSAYLKKRFSITKIGLFGSYATDNMTSDSDIDILVEFEKPTFDNYMDTKFFLEDLFATSVDLVIADTIKPRIKERIFNEVHFAQRL